MSKVSAINTVSPGAIPTIDDVIVDLESQVIEGMQRVLQDENPRSFSDEIQYIPFIFSVLYNHNQNSEVLEEDFLNELYEKASWMIDNANNIFAGNTNNRWKGNGNWQTIKENPFHGVTSNVRFFLPYKIPKEFLYPFFPANTYQNVRDVNFTSINAFKDSFSHGLYNIPTVDSFSYTSSYTYEEIRDKRNLVKDLYDQSLLNNNLDRAISDQLETEKENLRLMEEDYFLFFSSSRPGLLFVKRFNNDEGFHKYDGSYQMNAIRSIEHGDLPDYRNSVHDIGYTGRLYDLSNLWHPSEGLFANIPVFKVNTTSQYGAYGNGFLGSAVKGGVFMDRIYASGGFKVISINSTNATGDLQDFKRQTYSVFLHEFFHTLGYDHTRNGYSITGHVSFEGAEQNAYGRHVSSIRSSKDMDEMYMPFEPPFIYYDPFNPDHDLEDESTLPDFSIIDPNEKKYVETIINHVIPTGTDNFTTKVKFSFSAGSTWSAPGLHYSEQFANDTTGPMHTETTISYQHRRLGYAELFGMVSHLPTFWGGSYTVNEDGTKSLLINPATTQDLTDMSVGDFGHGGIVFQINEDGTGLVADLEDYDNGSRITLAHAIAVAETYTSEGYSDWYVPSSEEGKLMVNTIGHNGALGDLGNFGSSSSNWRLSSTPYGTIGHFMYNPLGSVGAQASTGTTPVRFIRAVADVTDTPLIRVGPNITVYNPVCLEDDNGERTKVNWALPWSLDWYNPDFPAFPDNTRVEDMFSPELCPCLYINQNLDIKSADATTSTNYNITLFNALIDETTGEEITTTTGTSVVSEGSKAITAYLKSTDLPPNAAGSYKGAFMMPAMFGGSVGRGNVGVNFSEYFGDDDSDIVWLKQVAAPSQGAPGKFVVPAFPVYTGFMPESPLPKFFRFNIGSGGYISNPIGASEIYQDKTDHNDPTIYSYWGQQFFSIINKYIRPGSTDPNAPDYNPFLIDAASSGIMSEVQLEISDYRTFQEWADYKIQTQGHATGQSYVTGYSPMAAFFERRLPNTNNPALDDMPDTLYGPLNQNTFTNLMYYESANIEPVLPTPAMMGRLNYLGESHPESPDIGLFALAKTFTNDLFVLDGPYHNVLPDYNQRVNKTEDQVNLYVATAMDYIESQALDPSSVVEGCTDPNAFNYDPNATFSAGNCIDRVFGCTNESAANYDSNANTDDGSCDYYSLVLQPIVQIPICPAEIVSACNSDTSGYIPIDMLDQVVDTSGGQTQAEKINLSYAGDTYGSGSNVDYFLKGMINDLNSPNWNNPEKVALLNTYRFGLGINGCTNELGSIAEGPLNLGGGCVNVIDFGQCIYPTVSNYQCDMLGEVTYFNPITNNSIGGNVTFSEAGTIQFEELAAYFDGVSSQGYTIGQCNTNENTK